MSMSKLRDHLSPKSENKQISFNGRTLLVNGEEFIPSSKSIGGSTAPVLCTDKQGNPKYVVKSGGSSGQTVAEKAAADVYNILGKQLKSGGAPESSLVDGKTVNKFVEGGQTLDKVNSEDRRRHDVFGQIRRTFIGDALTANWDFMGLNDDNVMLDNNKQMIRIDTGGTFQYRAQGAKKTLDHFQWKRGH